MTISRGDWKRDGWLMACLAMFASGCGPLGDFAQMVQGPSEVVGRDQQWFLDNVGVPCSKEISSMGGELWLYAQEQEGVKLLACGTPDVRRSWGIHFVGDVCTAAMSLNRPPG